MTAKKKPGKKSKNSVWLVRAGDTLILGSLPGGYLKLVCSKNVSDKLVTVTKTGVITIKNYKPKRAA